MKKTRTIIITISIVLSAFLVIPEITTAQTDTGCGLSLGNNQNSTTAAKTHHFQKSYKVISVPMYGILGPDGCGTAVAQMIAAYYNVSVSQSDISDWTGCGDSWQTGCTPIDLLWWFMNPTIYIGSDGLAKNDSYIIGPFTCPNNQNPSLLLKGRCNARLPTWNDIKTEIDNNRPVASLVCDASGNMCHWRVVRGYKSERIKGKIHYEEYVNDPDTNSIYWEDFNSPRPAGGGSGNDVQYAIIIVK